ncbi:MAG: hypothetical protein WEB57_07160 [Pseudohongiellaceae bacterium]
MFSEKALNLEENELREQIRALPEETRRRYLALESGALKNAGRYQWLNLLFFLGLHHFYLHRWIRGLLNLAVFASSISLLLTDELALYGSLVLVTLLIIEIPQMLNARHLVHSCNNRIMQRCLNRARAGHT